MLIDQTTKGIGTILSILTKKFQLTMVMVLVLGGIAIWAILGSHLSETYKMGAMIGAVMGTFIILCVLAIFAKKEEVETVQKQKTFEKQLEKDFETYKASLAKDVARELSIQKASDVILEWLKTPLDASHKKMKLSLGNGITIEVKTLSAGRVAITKDNGRTIGKVPIP